jgi:diguanylate cyclase (GGDEF)-like protein/PAS domain S-box-containing protein
VDIQWVLFGAVLIFNALIALLVAAFLGWRYGASGRAAMIGMLLSLAIWSFSYGMITFSSNVDTKIFWLRIENIGILAQPLFWLMFTLKYSNQSRALGWLYLGVLCLIPLVSLGMIFSDRWFHLYYSSVRPLLEHGGPLVIERGPWYWVALVEAYIVNGAATVLLIWRFIEFRNIFRRQLTLLIVAVLIPWIVNILYQLISNLAPDVLLPIDLTPISFMVSIALISSAIFRTRLLDLVPIARDVVMEHIPELVFVVDAHDRVLDANTVAEKWLGKTRDELIGRDPMEIFRQWPQLLNRFLSTEQTREEVEIPGEDPRVLQIVVTPLYDAISGELDGRVIVAHDITESKQSQNDLMAMNEILWTKIAEVEDLKTTLQEQAIRDGLTGVFNRRFLSETLDKELARGARDGTPISIVMMDVDHFKKFNDTYGHKCGDLVLKELAKFLMSNSRDGDIVCRYGGEEFVVLLPNATHEAAFERAEFWRQGYTATPFEFNGLQLYVSFSAGVAGYPEHGGDGEALLHSADHALYHSKHHGRNRVTLYNKDHLEKTGHAN